MVDYERRLVRILVAWRWVLFLVLGLDLVRGAALYESLGALKIPGAALLAPAGTSVAPMIGLLGVWSVVATFLLLTVNASWVPPVLCGVDTALGVLFVLQEKTLFAALLFALPIVQAFFISSMVGIVAAALMTVLYPVLAIVKSHEAGIVTQPFVTWYFAYVALAVVAGFVHEFFSRQIEQTQTLVSVVETNQELGTSVSEEKILSVVAQNVKKMFHCTSCVIFVRDLDHDKESLLRAAHSSTSVPDAFTDFNYDSKRSVVGQAIRTRHGVLLADFQKCDEEDAIRKDPALHAAMVVPLLFEDRALGAIFVSHSRTGIYQDSHLRLLTLLANQAALAVRNLQLHKTTAALAITDSLSGLYTHGYFQEHLARDIVTVRNAKEPMSLMIIDVDFFKKVNDTYGHPQGDALLKQLGGLIKEVARPEDVLCRYGGDEFTITMPRTNRIGAVVVAERLRETVESYEFVLGSQIVHITVSGGVASFPEDADTSKELVEKADRAMYEAKEKGRNRVCFAA